MEEMVEETERPKTFKDAFNKLHDKLEDGEEETIADPEEEEEELTVDDNPSDAMPDWVSIPDGMKLPEGRQVAFMLFRGEWTDEPKRGDRQCILWNLTEADEKIAIKRTRGEPLRTIEEMAKQMIRSVDGVKADWTGKLGPGNVSAFWSQIGSRCRTLIKNHYLKTHSLNAEQQADFFSNCLVVRTVTG